MRATASAIAGLFIAMAFLWMRLDRAPPSWDDAGYLAKSLELYDTLTDKGVVAWAARFLHIMDNKPPLIAAAPAPIYFIAGRKYRAAYAVNLVFLAIMFAAVYGIARVFAGPRAGAIAVAFLGAIPLIYGLSHWYLVECGLVALVSLTIYIMVGWDESSGTARAISLGILFGLGFLMKASFPVYLFAPSIYFLNRLRATKSGWRALAPTALSCALIAGPWYVINLRHVVGTAIHAGSASTAETYGTGAALSFDAMGHYLFNLANAMPWLFVIAMPVLASVGWRRLDARTKKGCAMAALWISPLLVLTLGHYRDLRYAAPLCPAFALLLAWFADATIRRGAIAALGVIAIMLLGGIGVVQNSFESFGHPWRLGGLLLDVRRLNYARAYDPSSWPQQEILNDISHDAATHARESPSVLVAANSVRFNVDNFTLASLQSKKTADFGTTAYLTDPGQAIQAADGADYIIYKEGGEADQANFNLLQSTVLQRARSNGQFREISARTLPDEGIAHTIARRSEGIRPSNAYVSADLSDIPACTVTFAGELQLIGLSVARLNDAIEVKYRWRCLKPMMRDYYCFTHLADENGNVTGYLDHRFLNGDPPTSQWKTGDVASERLLFRLPSVGANPHEIRIGVYYRESGERLKIVESTFPIIQEGTAARVAVPWPR